MFGLHSLHGLHGLHDNERIGISLSCISDLPCFRSLFPTQFKIQSFQIFRLKMTKR